MMAMTAGALSLGNLDFSGDGKEGSTVAGPAVAEVARLWGVKEEALRKAVTGGDLTGGVQGQGGAREFGNYDDRFESNDYNTSAQCDANDRSAKKDKCGLEACKSADAGYYV